MILCQTYWLDYSALQRVHRSKSLPCTDICTYLWKHTLFFLITSDSGLEQTKPVTLAHCRRKKWMAVLKLSWMFRPNLIQPETSYFNIYKTDENVIVIESNVVMFPKNLSQHLLKCFYWSLKLKLLVVVGQSCSFRDMKSSSFKITWHNAMTHHTIHFDITWTYSPCM